MSNQNTKGYFKKTNSLLSVKMIYVLIITFVLLSVIIMFFTLSRPGVLPFLLELFYKLSTLILLMLMLTGLLSTTNNENSKPFNLKVFMHSLLIISLICLVSYSTKDSVLDLKYIPNSNYVEALGECDKRYFTNRHLNLKFRISETTFAINSCYDSWIQLGDVYRVKYLPNSKYIISITKIES